MKIKLRFKNVLYSNLRRIPDLKIALTAGHIAIRSLSEPLPSADRSAGGESRRDPMA